MVVDAPTNFGERLKSAMDKCATGKVEVSEIAEICGVSYQAVKKWIDSPDPKLAAIYAAKIAKRLRVNIAWLLLGEGPRIVGEVQTPVPYWPFEDVDRARYESLSPTRKGAAQKAMRDEIEKMEQIGMPGPNRANDMTA